MMKQIRIYFIKIDIELTRLYPIRLNTIDTTSFFFLCRGHKYDKIHVIHFAV